MDAKLELSKVPAEWKPRSQVGS